MQLKITHDFDRLVNTLQTTAKQTAFASAVALTRTGQDIKSAQQKEIDRVIDRPTRYTRNSVFLAKATPKVPYAEVWLKNGSKRTHYLEPLIEGGGRPLKRFEERLIAHGYMKAGERAVPGSGAILDQYGNMGKGQITKILSQMRTATVVGDYSNATNSRRSRAKRATEAYFFAGGRTTLTIVGGDRTVMQTSSAGKTFHLARGIWVRRTFGQWGTAIKPVLLFVPSATYRKIFDFYGVAQRVRDQRFANHFDTALRQALSTAR